MFTISMILNSISILILILIMVYLIKRYKEMNRYETQTFTDEFGIVHTRIFDTKLKMLVEYHKSNGEYYIFHNDRKGRLIGYKDHLGEDYSCILNKKGLPVQIEDYTHDKRESREYDERGRVISRIDLDTGLRKWYYYNEDNEVWRIKDSEGRNTYNLSNMPKNWEVQHV